MTQKNKKSGLLFKVLAMAMTLVFVLVLFAACGSDNGNTQQEPVEEPEEQPLVTVSEIDVQESADMTGFVDGMTNKDVKDMFGAIEVTMSDGTTKEITDYTVTTNPVEGGMEVTISYGIFKKTYVVPVVTEAEKDFALGKDLSYSASILLYNGSEIERADVTVNRINGAYELLVEDGDDVVGYKDGYFFVNDEMIDVTAITEQVELGIASLAEELVKGADIVPQLDDLVTMLKEDEATAEWYDLMVKNGYINEFEDKDGFEVTLSAKDLIDIINLHEEEAGNGSIGEQLVGLIDLIGEEYLGGVTVESLLNTIDMMNFVSGNKIYGANITENTITSFVSLLDDLTGDKIFDNAINEEKIVNVLLGINQFYLNGAYTEEEIQEIVANFDETYCSGLLADEGIAISEEQFQGIVTLVDMMLLDNLFGDTGLSVKDLRDGTLLNAFLDEMYAALDEEEFYFRISYTDGVGFEVFSTVSPRAKANDVEAPEGVQEGAANGPDDPEEVIAVLNQNGFAFSIEKNEEPVAISLKGKKIVTKDYFEALTVKVPGLGFEVEVEVSAHLGNVFAANKDIATISLSANGVEDAILIRVLPEFIYVDCTTANEELELGLTETTSIYYYEDIAASLQALFPAVDDAEEEEDLEVDPANDPGTEEEEEEGFELEFNLDLIVEMLGFFKFIEMPEVEEGEPTILDLIEKAKANFQTCTADAFIAFMNSIEKKDIYEGEEDEEELVGTTTYVYLTDTYADYADSLLEVLAQFIQVPTEEGYVEITSIKFLTELLGEDNVAMIEQIAGGEIEDILGDLELIVTEKEDYESISLTYWAFIGEDREDEEQLDDDDNWEERNIFFVSIEKGEVEDAVAIAALTEEEIKAATGEFDPSILLALLMPGAAE